MSPDVWFEWLFVGSVQLFVGYLVFERIKHRDIQGKLACGFVWLVFIAALFPESRLQKERSNLKLDAFPVAGESEHSRSGKADAPAGEGSVAPERDISYVKPFVWMYGKVRSYSKPLLVIWAAGLVILVLAGSIRFGVAHYHLVREPSILANEFLKTVESVKHEMNVFVPVGIQESERVSSPFLYGWIHPRIVLPTGMWQQLSQDEITNVVRHECMHLRRGDIFSYWCLLLITLVFWFHPGAWLLLRGFTRQRELACDADLIRKFGVARGEYAEAIVKLARRVSSKPLDNQIKTPAVAGIAEDQSLIEQRIEMIMKKKQKTANWGTVKASMCMILTIAMGFNLSTVLPGYAEGNESFSETEVTTLTKRGEEILEAVWGKKPKKGYALASTYYKSKVSYEEFKKRHLEDLGIEIKKRKLVDVSEVTGSQAVAGGTNAHLMYKVEVEQDGVAAAAVENIYLIKEKGEWLMTGHWIKPN